MELENSGMQSSKGLWWGVPGKRNKTKKSKGEQEWYLHNNDSSFSKRRDEQFWELPMMWADTRIVWHIQKTAEGSVMRRSVIKYLWDVFAPTLHLKLKQIRWIANVCNNHKTPLLCTTCVKTNLDLILRKSSALHVWKRLALTSHILCLSTVISWFFHSLHQAFSHLSFSCCCHSGSPYYLCCAFRSVSLLPFLFSRSDPPCDLWHDMTRSCIRPLCAGLSFWRHLWTLCTQRSCL